MRRSYVAQDVLDQIRACLGEGCAGYKLLRSRGIPPADCDSIATSWVDRVPTSFGDCEPGDAGCREWNAEHTLRVTLTKICMGPDGEPTFSTAGEDEAAVCFDDMVDLLEQCLQCADWSQVMSDNAISRIAYTDTIYDLDSSGGAYSAHLSLTIVAGECCP